MPKHYPVPVKVKADAQRETVELAIKITDDVVILKRLPLAEWQRMVAEVEGQLRVQRAQPEE